MGFLKRLFSRRSKKPSRPVITHNVDMPTPNLGTIDEETEAAATRLLRSSSTRFAVVKEISYSDLPPMPHPINNVINTPGASTVSLASSSVHCYPTYSVKVTGRHKQSGSLSSNAPSELNTDSDGDAGHLLRLRSDPSVASLLDLYDIHGRLPPNAFRDSPVKQGRPQTQRNGSTLRELLGPEAAKPDAGDSDISWADRVLGESDITTSISNMALTAANDAPSTHDRSDSHIHNDTTFTSNDNSLVSNLQSISSMEVEISSDIENIQTVEEHAPVQSPPKTPRRASQVFKFLADSDIHNEEDNTPNERPLPHVLSSAFSSPSSDTHDHVSTPDSSNSCSDDSPSPSTPPAIPIDAFDSYQSTSPPFPSPTKDHSAIKDVELPSMSPSPDSFRSNQTKRYTTDSHFSTSLAAEAREGGGKIHQAHKVRVIMTIPTTVIVTAPTPSTNHKDDDTPPPTRIPRGPRGQAKRAPGTFKQQIPMLAERSNTATRPSVHNDDYYTPAPLSSKKPSLNRTSSRGSNHSSLADSDISAPMKLGSSKLPRRKSAKRYSIGDSEKENGRSLTVRAEVPSTPLRSRSFVRGAIDLSMFQAPAGHTPSPASSTENALSSVGRRLMIDVRQQRRKAREAEKGLVKESKKAARTKPSTPYEL